MHGYIRTFMVLYACFLHVHYCTRACTWLSHMHTQTYIYVKTYKHKNTHTYTRQQVIQQFWKLLYTCYWNCCHYCSNINVKWPYWMKSWNYNNIITFFYVVHHYATASLLWDSWTGSLSVNGEEEQYMVGHKKGHNLCISTTGECWCLYVLVCI